MVVWGQQTGVMVKFQGGRLGWGRGQVVGVQAEKKKVKGELGVTQESAIGLKLAPHRYRAESSCITVL